MASAGEKRQRDETENEPDQPAEQDTAKVEDDPKPTADAEQAKPAGEAETASDDVIETGRMYFFYKYVTAQSCQHRYCAARRPRLPACAHTCQMRDGMHCADRGWRSRR